MKIEARKLAQDYGVDFAEVFAQQFLLVNDSKVKVEGFQKISLRSWSLYVGRILPVAKLQNKDVTLAFMGVAVDVDGNLISDKSLKEIWKKCGSVDTLIEQLNLCGGRYAFVVVSDLGARIYLDASSTMGALFDPRSHRVASTLFLVLDQPVIENTSYPANPRAATGEGGRYAFCQTPDLHVKRLMANHYLDLDTFEVHRHWPHPDMDLTCPMTYEAISERVDKVIARHIQIMGTLANQFTPAIVPLSGGQDSRQLMGYTKGFSKDIDCYFVHRNNMATGQDVVVAKEMAEAMNVPMETVDVLQTDTHRLSKLEAYRANLEYRLSQGILEGGPDLLPRFLEVLTGPPEGGVLMRGHVTDISKAVLWGQRAIKEFLASNGQQHMPRIGIPMLLLGDAEPENTGWYRQAYLEWYNTLPENARRRAMDFLSIEQFRSHNIGSHFYAFRRNFYMAPGCDRTIVELLVSLPPHVRINYYINDLILERIAPELVDIPYNKIWKADNKLREIRKPLAELLAEGPARL